MAKNILVVDDDQIILDSLCEFLRLEGYTVSRRNGYQTGDLGNAQTGICAGSNRCEYARWRRL